MNYLLMFVLAVLIVISIAGSFFGILVLWYLAVLIYDEIVLFGKEAHPTQIQKQEQEAEWEKFLSDLYEYHESRPLNVFRDGVNV